MTTAPRPRPPTVMTQVMRPSCEVHGAPELHSYFGVGINSFGSPCVMEAPEALWWSDGAAWDADDETSKKSATVFAANDALLQQGADAKGRKHHLVLAVGASLMPPAPVATWGHTGMHLPFEWVNVIDRDSGESTALFGPRHVRADIDGGKQVATIRWPGGGAAGPGNLAVCCDPADHVGTFASQTPSTVFLGMTHGDTAGALIAFTIANLGNTIIKLLVEKLAAFGSRRLAARLRRSIGRAASRALRALLRATRELGITAFGHAAERVEEEALARAFNVDEAAFEHTAIDDGIADLWDAHVVLP